jgi:hypothetical protein
LPNKQTRSDQLKALADEQRRQNPTLSEAGAFAQVYQDPANALRPHRIRYIKSPHEQVIAGWRTRFDLDQGAANGAQH